PEGGSGGSGAHSPPASASPGLPSGAPSDFMEHLRSTTGEGFESGAEPGSTEASQARRLHQDFGEMSSRYHSLKDDPFASLLLGAILGGGTLSSVMSSHKGEE